MEVNEEEIPEGGGGGLRLRGGNLDNNSPLNEREFTEESLRRGNVPIIFSSQQQQSTSYRTASSVIVDRRRIQHVRIQLEGKAEQTIKFHSENSCKPISDTP
uniref:Uncharacterized protein n=1 Tax=Meloidogyne floridensis TaxID=298350 RepID=A0A915NTA9_9BILA